MSKLKNVLKIFMVGAIMSVTICALTGCGKKENPEESNVASYEQPIINYFEGIKNKDLAKLQSAFPDFENNENSITQEDIDDMYESLESAYGANINIEYTLGEATLLEDDDLTDLRENIASAYTDVDTSKITSAYTVSITIKITGDGVEEATSEETTTENATEEVTEATTENATEEVTEATTEETEETTTEAATDNTQETEFYSIEYDGNWYVM